MAFSLKEITDMFFWKRKGYQNLPDEDKKKWGFIINRIMAKKFPDYAQKLNVRENLGGDLVMVMNLWWIRIAHEDTKDWKEWRWLNKLGKKSVVDKKTIDIIQKQHPFLTISDIEYLAKWYAEDFKEEIKYYKKLEVDYGK